MNLPDAPFGDRGPVARATSATSPITTAHVTPRTPSHRANLRALLAGIRDCDPLRATFDVAVRRFVRMERDEGRDIDDILLELQQVLRDHVEPQIPATQRAALRQGVLWFAVSEFHRAD